MGVSTVYGDPAALAADVADILVDTGTTIPALIGTPAVDLVTDINTLIGTPVADVSADIATVNGLIGVPSTSLADDTTAILADTMQLAGERLCFRYYIQRSSTFLGSTTPQEILLGTENTGVNLVKGVFAINYPAGCTLVDIYANIHYVGNQGAAVADGNIATYILRKGTAQALDVAPEASSVQIHDSPAITQGAGDVSVTASGTLSATALIEAAAGTAGGFQITISGQSGQNATVLSIDVATDSYFDVYVTRG